ncbi:MAG TPA: tripartite tricarboxylate transporter substrate-binding protein [Pseudolabrys sp.]|nr:tripartite tricarboxylate transporter substrate-binding protein [Pseudolabrys sp.]
MRHWLRTAISTGQLFFTALLATAALLAGAAAARADDYPNRPITIIVPFSAGGPTDILARLFGASMSQTLGQQFVIENVTGAGGSIGSTRAARANPDGYTLVMGNVGTHAAAVGLYKNLPYDPRKDFEPIMLVASTPMVAMVKLGFPAKTLAEFTAYAKTHSVTFGSAGIGSSSHLTWLLYTKLAGVKMQHVPYRGLSQAMNDLLAGQIDMMFDQVVTATPHILGGKVVPLAVTATKRAASIPNVPTSVEAGMPDLQTSVWSALFAPKGTPKAIVDKLNAAVDKAMHDPAITKRCEQLGADLPKADERTPQFLGQLVRSEVDKWTPLIVESGASQ